MVANRGIRLPHTMSSLRGGKKMLYTENMGQGSCYGEYLMEGGKYRHWNPTRSKLAAALIIGFDVELTDQSHILYLGAGAGTTVSHLSDIVCNGVIFAIERSPLAMLEMLDVIKGRGNIFPVLADASQPRLYPVFVESVDCIYQDIAQPNQGEIAARNARFLLRAGGLLLLMVKTRSVGVEVDDAVALQRQLDVLEPHFEIMQTMEIKPFYKGHYLVVACFKG